MSVLIRKFIYFSEFIKNLFKYRNKKVKCKKLQVWVGQVCTLKCKNCSQLFPYIKQYLYDINKVINNLACVLKYVEAEEIHIIGGEPFSHPKVHELINFICKNNPNKNNKIVSNGTIIPEQVTIETLVKNKDSFFVSLSSYDCVKEKQKLFKETIINYGIPFMTVLEDSDKWFYLGDPNQKEIKGEKTIKNNFQACHDRTCFTLADGVLSIYPRMHNSPLIKREGKQEKVMFIEHLPINKMPLIGFIARALIATCFSENTYRESCRFCYGVSGINNLYCEKAEQLEKCH